MIEQSIRPNHCPQDPVANVRESVGILFVIALSGAVLLSSLFIFKYALRDRTVYEELVDYLGEGINK